MPSYPGGIGMKNRFTLSELLLVASVLAVSVALTLGTTTRGRARGSYCADKLRALLRVSHQYAVDHRGMWMAPCDLKSGAYVRPLVNEGYIRTPWKVLMTARETELTCPELPRNGRWKVMQGYGSVYNNGSSYDPQVGLYIYSPEYAFAGTGKARRAVPWSKRIWFADSLNIAQPPFPSPLLFGHLPGYPRGGENFGAVNLTHDGRANVGTVDGGVVSAAPEDLTEYHFSVTGNKPLRHYSAWLRMYLDGGKVRRAGK